MSGILGYGRYEDDPEHVGCPRAKTDETPCVARDGDSATADDGVCVGCGALPADLLRALVCEVTRQGKPMTECTEMCAHQAAAQLLGPLRPDVCICAHGVERRLDDVFPPFPDEENQ
jgi:hypothetical protein